MDNSRFYFRFRWWHGLLILLVLGLFVLLWASSWDFTPKVKPKLFPGFALMVTNDAGIGYYIEPFKITFKSDNQILLILKSEQKQFVKGLNTTEIPLVAEFGSLETLRRGNLAKIKLESEVTATRWGLRRTVPVNRDTTIFELLDEAFNILK